MESNEQQLVNGLSDCDHKTDTNDDRSDHRSDDQKNGSNHENSQHLDLLKTQLSQSEEKLHKFKALAIKLKKELNEIKEQVISID
jgi:predicted nuclease with TOPRIM domain